VLRAGSRYSTDTARLHLCEQDRIDLERPASGRMCGSRKHRGPAIAGRASGHRRPISSNRTSRSWSGPGVNTVPALVARRGTMSRLIPKRVANFVPTPWTTVSVRLYCRIETFDPSAGKRIPR
jgi:hypothetical protein